MFVPLLGAVCSFLPESSRLPEAVAGHGAIGADLESAASCVAWIAASSSSIFTPYDGRKILE